MAFARAFNAGAARRSVPAVFHARDAFPRDKTATFQHVHQFPALME